MIRIIVVTLVSLVLATAAFGQQGEGLLIENPLDEIRSALAEILEDSGIPFTKDQAQAIALVMDEQRRATEELFGQVLDFRGGPPRGAQLDQALAGIAFMSESFLESLEPVLTPEQNEAWMAARLEGAVPEGAQIGAEAGGVAVGGGGTSDQISQIRINNNPYTAETLAQGGFGGRGRRGRGGGGGNNNEVITRGDDHGRTAPPTGRRPAQRSDAQCRGCAPQPRSGLGSDAPRFSASGGGARLCPAR